MLFNRDSLGLTNCGDCSLAVILRIFYSFYETSLKLNRLNSLFVNFNECLFHFLQQEVKEKAAIEDAKKEEATPEEDPKGIPEFWLTIFKSVDMLSDMLQVHFNQGSLTHAL